MKVSRVKRGEDKVMDNAVKTHGNITSDEEGSGRSADAMMKGGAERKDTNRQKREDDT